jgi:hypothetical protein
VDLTSSNFAKIVKQGKLFVDKSLFIEHFLNEPQDVQIIARQRRLGKSLNLKMLSCFLTDREDCRPLFENLSIRKSPVWGMAHSAPTFLFDFKGLGVDEYKRQIQNMANEYCSVYANDPKCPPYLKELYTEYSAAGKWTSDAILILTKMAYAVTGKLSYILIDEYDKLLIDIVGTDAYACVRDYLTKVLSSAMKGNDYLEKGLLTGVMRISHEGMLSGLNNPQTYDVFSDKAYVKDYGLTKEEVEELCKATGLKQEDMAAWYNGVRISGYEFFNTFSVMSAVCNDSYSCYWGKSGTMDLVSSLSSALQKNALMGLLAPDSKLEVKIEERVSPAAFQTGCSDEALYSLLIQAGYLSLDAWNQTTGIVRIPNKELEEVWRKFIFTNFFPNAGSELQGIFRILEPERIASELELYLLASFDSLSFHNMPSHVYKDGKRRTYEVYYHNVVFGLLMGGRSDLKYDSLLSNRESGDGRYDIDMELRKICIVFEFKSAAEDEDLMCMAVKAVDHIKEKRYGFSSEHPIIGIGISCYKKRCKVIGRWIEHSTVNRGL